MFEILSTVLKYIFVTIIYLFIYSIIRLIYLDIRSVDTSVRKREKHVPYLKLINRREDLSFKVKEHYALNGVVLLGRSGKNDIVIADPYISGSHARFTPRDGQYYIEDLNSTNGTFVNDTRLKNEPKVLRNGDRIQMGQVEFVFVDGSRHKR